jgi:hypothetical protein
LVHFHDGFVIARDKRFQVTDLKRDSSALGKEKVGKKQ